MSNKLEYIIGAIAIILVANTFFLYQIIVKQNTLVEINRESHLGNLLLQYYSDLDACYASISDNPDLTEGKCNQDLQNSELAGLIKKWGGEKYLSQ